MLKAAASSASAFYFPSVTSSVAISLVFLFLFTGAGAVNAVLGAFGIDGPAWFADPRGLLHLARRRRSGCGTVRPAGGAHRTRRPRPVAGGSGCPGRAWP